MSNRTPTPPGSRDSRQLKRPVTENPDKRPEQPGEHGSHEATPPRSFAGTDKGKNSNPYGTSQRTPSHLNRPLSGLKLRFLAL